MEIFFLSFAAVAVSIVAAPLFAATIFFWHDFFTR